MEREESADVGGGSESSGELWVVATPIGNLGDIAPRAVAALKRADQVLAEDTRRTRELLSHLGIRSPLETLNAHTSPEAIRAVVRRLAAGASMALVSDAGTPAISDPGASLVLACHRARVRVRSLPGPSAATAAAAVSGLVEGPFLFAGFLPRAGQKRQAWLVRLAASPEPVVLFESPKRVSRTLGELARLMPTRLACVAREVSKIHEEVRVDTLEHLAAAEAPWRGEVVIVLGAGPELGALGSAEIDDLIRRCLERGASVRSVAQQLAPLCEMSRRDVYARVLEVSAGLHPDD